MADSEMSNVASATASTTSQNTKLTMRSNTRCTDARPCNVSTTLRHTLQLSSSRHQTEQQEIGAAEDKLQNHTTSHAAAPRRGIEASTYAHRVCIISTNSGSETRPSLSESAKPKTCDTMIAIAGSALLPSATAKSSCVRLRATFVAMEWPSSAPRGLAVAAAPPPGAVETGDAGMIGDRMALRAAKPDCDSHANVGALLLPTLALEAGSGPFEVP